LDPVLDKANGIVVPMKLQEHFGNLAARPVWNRHVRESLYFHSEFQSFFPHGYRLMPLCLIHDACEQRGHALHVWAGTFQIKESTRNHFHNVFRSFLWPHSKQSHHVHEWRCLTSQPSIAISKRQDAFLQNQGTVGLNNTLRHFETTSRFLGIGTLVLLLVTTPIALLTFSATIRDELAACTLSQELCGCLARNATGFHLELGFELDWNVRDPPILHRHDHCFFPSVVFTSTHCSSTTSARLLVQCSMLLQQ
jgi:hypothetical protein